MNAQTNSDAVENIMKLADAYAVAAQGYTLGGYSSGELSRARSDLLAAVEELAKDAERYRWLRKNAFGRWRIEVFRGQWNPLHTISLDSEIDTYMRG